MEQKSIDLKSELRRLILIALVSFGVFANSLGGGFVYDDNRQILRNPLIQDPSLYGQALVSDVWAFKGDGKIAASNYYRPSFVAWLILNFNLFGTSPFGWHLLNVLLHAAVCLLGYLLLRRWNVSQKTALAVALVFAVHPVHTESVAWISGSPDLLFAITFLASIWFADKWAVGKRIGDIALALVLYALALGSKEVALTCLPIYFLVFAERNADGPAEKQRSFLGTPMSAAAMFACVAAIYFVVRWSVLGEITRPVEDATGGSAALLSVPSVIVFYLKQMFFPLILGENYPLRPVNAITLANFVLPLIVVGAGAVGIWFAARTSFLRKCGAALLLLPLLPVLNAGSFPSDQIVHDRYLYLPLFGLLIIIFSLAEEWLDKLVPEKAGTAIVVIAVLASVPLAIQTVAYNRVWKNDLALWAHNTTIDPTSAFTFVNYGAELSSSGKYPEAVAAFDRSIENRPTALAFMGRARNYIALKRFDEAIADLQTVITMPSENVNAYTLYQSYESLALAYSQTGDLTKAEQTLREARGRLPIYAAALTEKLAVVLYQKGDKEKALAELENARAQARIELLPESKTVLLRLGMLYAERGNKQAAKSAVQEYLNATAKQKDSVTLSDRQQAANLLKTLQ